MLEYRDHETCRHFRYSLSCDEFDQMLEACGHACQICRKPSSENRSIGKLFIDHDHDHGDWAVRGLLCGRCNSILRHDRTPPPEAAAYLADPWYKRMLAETGLDPWVPEPGTGGVRDVNGGYWYRHPDTGLWGIRTRFREAPTWRELFRAFGPRGLAPVNRDGSIAAPNLGVRR